MNVRPGKPTGTLGNILTIPWSARKTYKQFLWWYTVKSRPFKFQSILWFLNLNFTSPLIPKHWGFLSVLKVLLFCYRLPPYRNTHNLQLVTIWDPNVSYEFRRCMGEGFNLTKPHGCEDLFVYRDVVIELKKKVRPSGHALASVSLPVVLQ